MTETHQEVRIRMTKDGENEDGIKTPKETKPGVAHALFGPKRYHSKNETRLMTLKTL